MTKATHCINQQKDITYFLLLFQNPKIVGGAIKLRGDQNKTFHLMNGDELVNDEELQEQMEIAELCNSGNCNQIPSTNLMKIKVNDDFFCSLKLI